MKYRYLPNSNYALSPITFGSMRLDATRTDADNAVQILERLMEAGINGFHSSYEYATHDYFCETLKKIDKKKRDKIIHICKIPLPHFKDDGFSERLLVTRIESQLKALQTDCLHIVQWLFRREPNEDAVRLPLLKKWQAAIEAAWQRLQAQGKIGVVMTFPYTNDFAFACLENPTCIGVVDYLNLIETSAVPVLKRLQETQKGFIALRPLKAKAVLDTPYCKASQDPLLSALSFPLLHPSVVSSVLSVNTIEQANQAIVVANQAKIDENKFFEVIAQLTGIEE